MFPNETLMKSRTFHVRILTRDKKYLLWDDHSTHLPVHDKVVAPLVAISTKAYVYGLSNNADLLELAKPIVTKDRRRHALDLSGDCVTGYEQLWNANCGKRGTIVLLVPQENMESNTLFSHCVSVNLVDNFRAGHTPAAIEFARRTTESGEYVAFCFSRNNGLEWVDVFACEKDIQHWYNFAKSKPKRR